MSTLERLSHPIVLAPMAGGPGTPELAAAVSNAGGLGFLAAGYRPAATLAADLDAMRTTTRSPFGVNLFVPGRKRVDEAAVAAYAERLGGEARRYEVELGEPRWDDDGWQAKLDALMRTPPDVVSFTFGCADADVVGALRQAGCEVWVTVTSVAEARTAVRRGADGLVAQGVEAGGHRATWDDRDESGLGMVELTRALPADVAVPIVAAGGIADGPAARAGLDAGAVAVQIGSAFLLADEAGTHPAHRALVAGGRATALTRAFTGRLARGLVNRFLHEHSDHAPRAYPHVHQLTAPLRAAARDRGDGEAFNLWAGEAHHLARPQAASAIVRRLGREIG